MKLKLTDTVEHTIEIFSKTGSHEIEVIDDHNHTVGFFTIEDLLFAIQKGELLENIAHVIRKKVENKKKTYPENTQHDFSGLIQSQLFNEIIDSLYDGVYITDGDGYTVKINKAYERITGIKKEEVLGFHMETIIEKGLISHSVSIEVLKSKKPITMMQTIRHGRKILVSGTPIFNKDKTILFVINSVRDITELLQMKHDLDKLNYWESSFNRDPDHTNFNTLFDATSFVSSRETSELYRLGQRVAKTDVTVLIQGETGVGKGFISKFIHENSQRKDFPFFSINCAAIPANLLEAELFGYEAGAFTGAAKNGKKGLLELADRGTFFLDEIGDLSLDLQVKILKVVEEKKIMRVGSTDIIDVDVRLISATNKDLKQLVEQGKFREDLYYRLNVVPLLVPPLRERKSEIIPLFNFYLNKFNDKYHEEKIIDIECLEWLLKYSWPGNIRQLINLVERLVVTVENQTITIQDLPKEYLEEQNNEVLPDSEIKIKPLKQAVEEVERELIFHSLKKYKTTRKAAEALEVSQATIVQKMKKWNQ